MFLTLDSDLTDDFEKMKRIATDVQHYCISGDEFSKNIITDVAIKAIPMPTTSIQLPDPINTNNRSLDNKSKTDTLTKSSKPSKKYKRISNNNNNTNNNSNRNNDNNNNHQHNNNDSNNNHINSNSDNSSTGMINNDNNNNLNVTNHNNNGVGPSNIQQQRKERSLHYCSICSKGFKDKYSVNVHHRTHTGRHNIVVVILKQNAVSYSVIFPYNYFLFPPLPLFR